MHMGEHFPVSTCPAWSSRGWHGSFLQAVAASAAAKVVESWTFVAVPETAVAAAVVLAVLVG